MQQLHVMTRIPKKKGMVAMKRPTKIDTVRDKFLVEISACVSFALDIMKALNGADKSILKSLPLRLEQIHEFAFLRLMLSWEVFLERTLVLYMMGEKSGSGYRPDVKVKNIKDETIAYILLSGRMKFDIETHHLPYLSAPGEIKQVASTLFDNHCYDFSDQNPDKEKQNLDLFEHARHIRNHIAHRSRSSEAKFKSTAEHFVGKSHNCSAGRLLIERVNEEMQFGDYFVDRNFSYFTAYCVFFSHLANKVAPRNEI